MLWVLDLDDTVYGPSAELERQFINRIAQVLSQLSDVPQDSLGELIYPLMKKHRTDFAVVAFALEHGISHEDLVKKIFSGVDLHKFNLALRPGIRTILDIPDETQILTNAPGPFAEHVLRHFRALDRIHDIHGSGLQALVKKPAPIVYDRIEHDGKIVMIDDKEQNLVVPKNRGWTTVWFPITMPTQPVPAHVDYCLADLTPLPSLVS